MPHSFALKLFNAATIVMCSRTEADCRRLGGRSLVAGDGVAAGSDWLAGGCFDWSMDSSAFAAAHGDFQLKAGKSSSYPSATGTCL